MDENFVTGLNFIFLQKNLNTKLNPNKIRIGSTEGRCAHLRYEYAILFHVVGRSKCPFNCLECINNIINWYVWHLYATDPHITLYYELNR